MTWTTVRIAVHCITHNVALVSGLHWDRPVIGPAQPCNENTTVIGSLVVERRHKKGTYLSPPH